MSKSGASTFPDELYLKQRAEITKQTETRVGLVASMNRCFGDGARIISKSDIGVFGHENWPYIEELFAQWESNGWLRVTRPLNVAVPTDDVVEMLDFINQEKHVVSTPTKSA